MNSGIDKSLQSSLRDPYKLGLLGIVGSIDDGVKEEKMTLIGGLIRPLICVNILG